MECKTWTYGRAALNTTVGRTIVGFSARRCLLALVIACTALGNASFAAGDRALGDVGATDSTPPPARYEHPTPHAGGLSFELATPRTLAAAYEGREELRRELELDLARSTALASGDFDGDGIDDLVCGYSGSEGGIVTLHRGNADAIFPHTPEARTRRALGTFTDEPFLSPARIYPSPGGADFIGTGDFDNDGNLDVVAAPRGGDHLQLLAGDGHGRLRLGTTVKLPGSVLAMVTGEIDPADGLADIAVAVSGPEGRAMVVFQGPEGAFRSGPVVTAMPAPADARSAAGPDRRAVLDLAAGAGIELEDWIALAEEKLGVSPAAAQPMRLDADAVTDLVLLPVGGGAPSVASGAAAATITVNTSLDNATAGDGDCTLREALTNANSDSDTTGGDCAAGSGADEIHFSIGGGGASATIAPSSALPTITGAVTINGNTQGCAGPPCIELDGTSAGASVNGLFITGGNSTIRGLVVNRFDLSGIRIESDNNFIEGNFVGTDIAGTTDLGNGQLGVAIVHGWDNTVGGTTEAARNVVSGNGSDGVLVAGDAQGNLVLGNYIGIDVTGSVALGNDLVGVEVDQGSNNTVGGTTASARNVISGNGQSGIFFDNATGNQAVGNYIGTDVSGTADLGNSQRGVLVGDSPNNTIGGTAAGARNIISGNDTTGVFIAGSLSDGNQVLGNYIGVDVNGTADLGNGSSGVEVETGSDNTIGGTTPGARNVISGNAGNGIFFDRTTGNEALGNYIGTDASGTADLGNSLRGVLIGDSPNNTIGGTDPGARNIISGNDANGVWIPGSLSDGNQVLGNYIGTDVSGTADLGNGNVGVEVESGSGNTIGGTAPGARNVISGNGQSGVLFDNASGNQALGNYIGTDASGTVDLGNTEQGVLIGDSTNNTIGGTDPAARNIISGNDSNGVWIAGSLSDGNQVLGNYIGVDVSGTASLGNGLLGVEIQDGTNNTVGGTALGSRNVISGNAEAGILIENSSGNQVVGNYIGTDASGMVDIGNAFEGVRIQAGSTNNTIGGATAAARNIISGNDRNGVVITGSTSSFNTVQGNYIGTDVTRWGPLGNASRGVHISDGAFDNPIGGSVPGEGNVIVYNAEEGVNVIGTGAGNPILGNSIASNGLLEIDLAEDGVTINDNRDPDAGPNDLQNYPVLTQADATTTPDIIIGGDLNSLRNEVFRIEFFASSDCDSSGFGDGGRFLGSTTETTGGSGDVSFSMTLLAPVSDGEVITATATNPANSTSEFAQCFTATCSAFVVFPHMITAADKNTLEWLAPEDVKFAKGDLAAVGTYTTTGDGFWMGATTLDISADNPAPGNGLYYVVKPLGCGGWETSAGAEPGRDGSLP